MASLYNNCISQVQVQGECSRTFRLKKGVRQGDTLSPKVFNAGLEQVFRALHWETKGVKINGEMLNHLRFADDIVLISHSALELQGMLSELNAESLRLGLKMNMKKTRVMFNNLAKADGISIGVAGKPVEIIENNIYLGQ